MESGAWDWDGWVSAAIGSRALYNGTLLITSLFFAAEAALKCLAYTPSLLLRSGWEQLQLLLAVLPFLGLVVTPITPHVLWEGELSHLVWTSSLLRLARPLRSVQLRRLVMSM